MNFRFILRPNLFKIERYCLLTMCVQRSQGQNRISLSDKFNPTPAICTQTLLNNRQILIYNMTKSNSVAAGPCRKRGQPVEFINSLTGGRQLDKPHLSPSRLLFPATNHHHRRRIPIHHRALIARGMKETPTLYKQIRNEATKAINTPPAGD